MFDGWMSYGGQEIFNAARTRAYLEHLQPSLSIGADCCPCDTLAEALGDEPYGTPAQDDAEWFNPYATETAGFYGLLPLAVEGFEDSTYSVPIVELLGDGSISGRGRRGGRDLRFKMLAVAESEKAMSRGLSWLRDVLGAENCASGDCGGAQVCYLTDCPGCCSEDAPEVEEIVDHLDYRALSTSAAAAAGKADWVSTATPKGYKTTALQTYAWWDVSTGVHVERTIDGFLPGATYRIALDFGANAGPATEVTLTIPGASELLAPRRVDAGFLHTASPEQGVVVWEFIATECVHRFVVESSADLMIGLLDVALTANDSLAYSGQPSYYVSQATSWSSTLPDQVNVSVTQPSSGLWRYAASGTYAVGAGIAEVRSIIPGLKPNRNYRVSVLSTTYDATSEVGLIKVYDRAGVVLGTAQTVPSPFGGGVHGSWTTIDFLANDRAAYLSVANANAVTVNATNTLFVGIKAVTVEELLAVPVIPDPNDPLRRYLRDVVLTSGPSVTTVYPSYTAVMKEIEWTMRANVPDPFGEDVLITSTLGAGQWIVPEITCSMGEAVRTNWMPNPSGEYGALGWQVPSGVTITNPVSPTALAGTHVIRWTHAAGSGNRVSLVATAPVIAGTVWTFTVPARGSKSGRIVRAHIDFYKGATAVGSAVLDLTLSDSTTDWQNLTVSPVIPPGVTEARAHIIAMPNGTNWLANEWMEFDAVMLEQAYGKRSFFDGDSLHGTWSGTPGNSTSGYERTTSVLVFDPACPPTPPAPRPPDIVNICLTTPSTWIRYVLDLPALASAASPRAAPVVTIGTGNADARGVRVRVYANPFGRTMEEVDPCAFCGEFLISYMPAQASLTIDGADRSAVISTPLGEQSALPLLFGSDGGPVVWPTIGCAIPYLVTVDVDADVAPLIAASLSVTPIY